MDKSDAAFRTIGEVSADLGVAQHVLRYWETRFPQLRPITRAGNRRYYRPADVALVRRIDGLLNKEGYTVRGVQKLLAARGGAAATAPAVHSEATAEPALPSGAVLDELLMIRTQLARALSAS
jgi:DNA-binding transcriptional MerR regulator